MTDTNPPYQVEGRGCSYSIVAEDGPYVWLKNKTGGYRVVLKDDLVPMPRTIPEIEREAWHEFDEFMCQSGADPDGARKGFGQIVRAALLEARGRE